MAHIMHSLTHPFETIASRRVKEPSQTEAAAQEEKPASLQLLGLSPALALILCVVLLALVGWLAFYLASSNPKTAKSTPAPTSSAAAPAKTAPAPAAKLSAADLKEMQARDDYAAKLSKFMRAKMPAYKNVQIYADSWTGTKPPAHIPLANIKQRTGDNLMLVFWSPEAGTARALGDFTKSRASIEAVQAGFAELQFIDPDTYCFAQVAPVTGIGPVICGIR